MNINLSSLYLPVPLNLSESARVQLPKITPMLEQYLSMKKEYHDALLFFRIGDFYELFFEDAETAARELAITLTSRNRDVEVPVPMAGVPHYTAESYFSRLLHKGYRIAVCDQIGDPRQAKGLVKRAVSRVLTPGTTLEDTALKAKVSNYLAAIYWDAARGAGGLAWIDYSTGEWSGLAGRNETELWEWVAKLEVKEVLLTEVQVPGIQVGERRICVTRRPERLFFDPLVAEERICRVQGVASLNVLELEDKPELVRACGALLVYLEQTQKQALTHLGPFVPLHLGRHLLLDEVTERNLEVFRRLDGRVGSGTLWQVLDRTLTPMGGRLLQERLRHPWRDSGPILETQEAVSFLVAHDSLRTALRQRLKIVYDLERLSTRIYLGRATPRDFVALGRSLAILPELRMCLSEALVALAQGTAAPKVIVELLVGWDDLADYAGLLLRGLKEPPPPVVTEGGLFNAGYNAALDELVDLVERGESKIQELFVQEQQEANLPRLKLGHNRVFGYYFEAAKYLAVKVPSHFVRRQTLANCERYTTEALKSLEEKLIIAAEKRKTLEYELFDLLRERVAAGRQRLLYMADILAILDYWQALAECARVWEWSKPIVHDGLDLSIISGRHPVVEAVQGQARFIPNDLHLAVDRIVCLITGPNMSGKSTVLRQTAIITLLAQIGSYVPAKEARIGLVDRIFSRVGASDNLAHGQSTFMVEMVETARILRQATNRSLVILDEIGRGTSTFDGLALAWAVVEELATQGHEGIRTLFATHYHELTVLEGILFGVCNMNVAAKECDGEIIFLRRLVPGPADRSYGIEVAQLAGVPHMVVARARKILIELEKKFSERNPSLKLANMAQAMLPGCMPPTKPIQGGKHKQVELLAPSSNVPIQPHPLLVELAAIQLDKLTPLEALNMLQQWKVRWDDRKVTNKLFDS